MEQTAPTFWLLDGTTGWRTLRRIDVSVGARSGIGLAANPSGPLSLRWPDGSMGGLTLPRRIAVDEEGTVYLLVVPADRVERFDPATRTFKGLPQVGGQGTEPRQFRRPTNLTAVGGTLYVADRGNRRVQVFDLATFALLSVLGPLDDAGNAVAAGDPTGWRPVDVAAAGGRAYILDRRFGRVYQHRPGREGMELVVSREESAGRWSRVALDRGQRLYLLDRESGALDVFDQRGRPVDRVGEASDVADRFDLPPIRLDHRGRFCIPGSLTRLCARRRPDPGPIAGAPLALCGPELGERGATLFDLQGRVVHPEADERPGPPLYMRKGTWFGGPLDSQIYRCVWHRIELEMPAIPPGSRVTVSTYTDEVAQLDFDLEDLPESRWNTRYSVVGPSQPPPAAAAAPPGREEFLIQSAGGRYLWLRVEMTSDGYGTPGVTAIRAHYPRISYLEYLPAVFSTPQDGRAFLERFLSIFQTELRGVEQQVRDVPRLFDPKAVPEGALLEYLAGWLALALEGSWSEAQKRRLLEAAPTLYPRRGTPDGLRDFVRVYLRNITGLDDGDLPPGGWSAYPQIVEGFRERRHLMLASSDSAGLGAPAPLWSRSVVGRLQVGVHAHMGEARVVTTGDPERDLFHHYGHRFRVFVPAVWIRTAEHERLLRRAIESDKPAHTAYDLCLVEPRLRVEIQSTVGLDTVIGGYPKARLASACDDLTASGRTAGAVLGFDTLLACPGPKPWRLNGSVRADGGAVLA